MKLSFNLTVDDWVAFQQYYQGKKVPLYKFVYGLMIGLVIALVVINIASLAYLQEVTSINWISLIFAFVLLYIFYIRKKSLERIKHAGLELQKKNPGAFGSITMDFEDKGIEIRSEQSSKTVTWDEMNTFEENKNYFFLYSKKGVIYIIPKRDIDNAHQTREILINYFSKEKLIGSGADNQK